MAELNDQETQAMRMILDQLTQGEAHLYEHVSATFRWLLATLFTANAGGMVALLGEAGAGLPGRMYALGWLAIGLVCSLLMGAFSSFAALRASLKITRSRVAIQTGLITGEIPVDAIQQMVKDHAFSWKTWFPTYAGIASLISFAIGVGTIAGSLIRQGW